MPLLLPMAPPSTPPADFWDATVSTTSATSLTLPQHSPGQMIVLFVANTTGVAGSTTMPTKPTASGATPAWVDISTKNNTTGLALYTVYFVATGTHTSGTWTNASTLMAVVIKNIGVTPLGGFGTLSDADVGAPSGDLNSAAPAVTLAQTDGSSILLHAMVARSNSTAWNAAPSGYAQMLTNGAMCLDIKLNTTSDGQLINTHASLGSTAGHYIGSTVEVRAH